MDDLIANVSCDHDTDFLDILSNIPIADASGDQSARTIRAHSDVTTKHIVVRKKPRLLNKFVANKKLEKFGAKCVHTPKLMAYSVDPQSKKRTDKRRKCIICKTRVSSSCKECNFALCFELSDDAKGIPCCWEVFHKLLTTPAVAVPRQSS
jgi:hypothetical protein